MDIRINKYLSAMGICSRREADRMLLEGRITVNGKRVEAGYRLTDNEEVEIDGISVGKTEDVSHVEPVFLAVYKPVGIVCTTSNNDRAKNIVELVDYPERIYPVGRLDKDSEGLIFMTNRGEIVNHILRSSLNHEKEYVVRTDKSITDDFLDKMSRGIYLKELDVTTKPCFVEAESKNCFKIILTQGLNRQIRRMCENLGYQVLSLKRIRIMNINLGNLKPGEYRHLENKEIEELEQTL